ncbi:Ataxin-10 domain [Dillenia turbinata]|uniref:Ataxin-10 domain n=1 Tax=Dillenia turbinata TaxID=194707 RepID=A0AAN8UY83_9MAGN
MKESQLGFSSSEELIHSLLKSSSSSTIDEALEILIRTSKTANGRADLASKHILPTVLQLCGSVSQFSNQHLLIPSLKLLRNLCAGEIVNQNYFIEQGGVRIISSILETWGPVSDLEYGVIRMGLQVLANVALAGNEQQRVIWDHFFPDGFVGLARIRRRETCDPLCMIIYTCCNGDSTLLAELCGDCSLSVVMEIVHTASEVGFREDWLKILLSRVCFEEFCFSPLFLKLCPNDAPKGDENVPSRNACFSLEQGFLLRILTEIVNERIGEISISGGVALSILGIFKRVLGVINFDSRASSGLPSGSVEIDVLGYALAILRDICAHGGCPGLMDDSQDAIDLLLSAGLLELLLCLLKDLEPPAIIRKAVSQSDYSQTTSEKPKLCPYKGFRRDIVAVIGNCLYQRKHAQDEIRQRNGIFLLLQQCVTDEENPFLREWGIWSIRNLLEGNEDNQKVVADLELQGSVDVPELAGLGLRVEVDQKTRRAKLVNVP